MRQLYLIIIAFATSMAAAGESRNHAVVPHGEIAKDAKPQIILKAGDEAVGRVWLAYDEAALHLRYRIFDASPLMNSGDNWQMLFKTGDSVDLQIGLDPTAPPNRVEPVPGDIRVQMTRTKDGPVIVIYRYRVPQTERVTDSQRQASDPVIFGSPMGRVVVDRVEKLADVKPAIETMDDGYVFAVSLPWKTLAGREFAAKPGFAPKPGTRLRGDVGVLFSDPDGGITVERIYWSNKNTSVVADVPTEIRLTPSAWGEIELQTMNDER